MTEQDLKFKIELYCKRKRNVKTKKNNKKAPVWELYKFSCRVLFSLSSNSYVGYNIVSVYEKSGCGADICFLVISYKGVTKYADIRPENKDK